MFKLNTRAIDVFSEKNPVTNILTDQENDRKVLDMQKVESIESYFTSWYVVVSFFYSSILSLYL